MKYTRFIPQQDVANLQLEVISQELRIHLTRVLETRLPTENTYIIWQNRVINKSRRLIGLSTYTLDSGDDDFYLPVEHAWHNGEFEVIFRRLNTVVHPLNWTQDKNKINCVQEGAQDATDKKEFHGRIQGQDRTRTNQQE